MTLEGIFFGSMYILHTCFGLSNICVDHQQDLEGCQSADEIVYNSVTWMPGGSKFFQHGFLFVIQDVGIGQNLWIYETTIYYHI